MTIDGPSGSGKGTIGWRVAQNLGWEFLDSGAMYRLVALAALKRQLDLNAEDQITEQAANLNIEFQRGESETAHFRILLDNEDVTNEIRTEICGSAASRVAAIGAVREALLDKQRAFRKAPGLVADGRDMGTVVFPDAELKIFLTASAEERANRRYKQLKEKEIDANLRAILADIQERDKRDANRAVSPLKAADDAVVIDTTGKSIAQVEQEVLNLVKETV
jgi:cytidylate kinase